MMFKNKIPNLSKKKGLTNAFQLGKALGVSPTTASRLWNGDFDKIGIDMQVRLCFQV
jgi:transcriptional regulator with XRE-family HTH domain